MYGGLPARQFGQLLGALRHLTHLDLRCGAPGFRALPAVGSIESKFFVHM